MLAIAFLQLALVGLFSFHMLAQIVGNEVASRQALGQSAIALAAPAVERMAAAGDTAGIQRYLSRIMADRAISGITVKDAAGNILFRQYKPITTPHPAAQWFTAAPLQPLISAGLESDGPSRGLLTITLSNEGLNESTQSLLYNVAYLFLLLLAINLLAAGMLVRFFISPLAPLSSLAAKVAQGAWTSTIQPHPGASDEIRNLAEAFSESAKTMRRQIEELEQTRAQLAGSELRLRNLVDNMQEILLETDQAGRITFLNPAWESLTGYAIETSLGRPFAEFLAQPSHQVYFMPERLVQIGLYDLQLELRTQSGNSCWVQMNTTLQYDEAGEFTGIIGTLVDTTENLRLQQQQREHEQDLYRLTITDPLTGIHNRRHFDDLLANLLHMNLHRELPLALLIVDIDGFKFINDTYGHPVGDEALKSVAQTLRANVPQSGAVARLAGDEFAVLLQNVDEEQAGRIARMIHDDIARIAIPLPVGELKLQTSIGVAVAPVHGRAPLDLVRAADVALYHAKRSGRNRVDTLSCDRGAAIMDIFSQGFELRNALGNGMIMPFMQPIVDLKTGEVMAYEVLTRMKRGSEYVPASEFVSIAEDLGLIREMDLFVIRQTLALVPKDIHLFLNISLNSFYTPEFSQELRDLLQSPDARNRPLTIEFTERQTTEISQEFVALFDGLRAGGCKIALDDFGVGYSTYSYLRRLKPEFVKIDGSFVQQMRGNHEDAKIVEHIKELSETCGAQSIAEHIEDEETLHHLAGLGVNYGQGYYFGKPVSIHERAWEGVGRAYGREVPGETGGCRV